MSRNVCLLRQSYFPEEAHVRKNVDALTDAGFAVDVVCLRAKGEAARERYRDGTVHRLPLTHKRSGTVRYVFEYAAFLLMAAVLLTARSLRNRYEIVEVYNIPDALVLAALPAKLLGAKIVFYMFELMPEQAAAEWELPPDHALVRRLRWIERLAVRIADRVITVSHYDREIVEQRDAPRPAPVVIPNVPEERLFNARRSVQPVPRNGVFRIITHGSILRRYGIQTLVRALPYLLERIPRVEVTILGEGEYRSDLEDLARELGVGDCVRFPGWIPHEDVPAEIARVDIGVVPASVPWLLPNKLFEYVAMGKPVVAAASPSLGPVFSDGCIAYFWPDDERDLARRIIELYEDQSRARHLASNALRAFDAYRWEVVREAYVGLHEDLLSEGNERRGEEAA